ncbi:sn-glycerol-3-phosphate ABC transporter ATP-binding protein UgpC [Celerinatantimonas diazotrophica]|uniref:Carbohydrate ABC transporter ATP-binding protein (CUT1 family) n=1 Tax=Celerinatantimonas diazotrophica TaxID=412034 RepID=A0A4V2PNA9_9GAMM|nr:sn-glycerol-3-phosphate ABC transporter ATP-binding protein UgpC [Celerinatantimonas diazotrophica]TCK46328.1 carbohydrate ABC transporter ATP-binding protein (CUT1 family) [Celerinatantimonas diazotrophica]CAG9295298.1 sn-glycerol-3-phosphate import ATP-binding protein UgpC [Celerinatantimonas diazotrophica]
MATVSLKHLTKTYLNGYQAIKGINLEIADGEMIVLVGPSGCGKSTLLRMLAGLETISTGDLSIDTTRVNEVEPGERDIAMVFQNYALYPHMSVFNNMAYGLKNRKVPKEQIKQKVVEAAKLLELEPLLERTPRELSGGQRQRVAMGRAIVRQPKVFLFDEPLSNLDAKLRVHMRLEIRRLQRRFNTTSVYVTHDQVEAMTLADRLVVLNAGHVEQVGTPVEVYQQPKSVFVATFIGSPAMNIIPGTVEKGIMTLPGGQQVELDERYWNQYGTLQLGIRPEDIEMAKPYSGLELVVKLIEPLGADTLVYATLANSDHEVVVRLSGYQQFNSEQSLFVDFTPSARHLFNRENQRI